MENKLTRLHIRNYHSLADVTIETHALNVLFGPNGAGKSKLLDAIGFMNDCMARGVDESSAYRMGVLWDRADKGANISIKFETDLVEYEVLFRFSFGKIEPFPGEILYSKANQVCLIDRKMSSDKAIFLLESPKIMTLRDPEKLALTKYLGLEHNYPEVTELDKLLGSVHFYHSRSINLSQLKNHGSETSHHLLLWSQGQNLWSVLRNLHDKRAIDNGYDTIISLMRKSFLHFRELVFTQTALNSVYGSFVEAGRLQPIPFASMSDGHLQMLILLTALFAEGPNKEALILFDEPEISLHPYALAIFAEAVKLATEEWHKQVFIATHSPVLISQFASPDILAVQIDSLGQTIITRLSEMDGLTDLLEEYAVGSLYMAEMIAPQSQFSFEESK